MNKRCIKCGEVKTLQEFVSNKPSKNGRANTCKTCGKNYKKEWDSQYRFGGNKNLVLKRDGNKCVECGMTQNNHQTKYGKELTIHHIDGQGRECPNPNNKIDNLITLCLKCHGRRDRLKRRDLNLKKENTSLNNELTRLKSQIESVKGALPSDEDMEKACYPDWTLDLDYVRQLRDRLLRILNTPAPSRSMKKRLNVQQGRDMNDGVYEHTSCDGCTLIDDETACSRCGSNYSLWTDNPQGKEE